MNFYELVSNSIADHENVAKILIHNGADVNVEYNTGTTSLHYASSCGKSFFFKFIIKNEKKNVSYLGMDEVVTMLIAKGANVNATNIKQDTPIHWAAKSGNCSNLF